MSDCREHDAASAPDDSGGEDWEELAEVDPFYGDEDEDESEWSIHSTTCGTSPSAPALVKQLVQDDACGVCLRGKEQQLEDFMRSHEQLTRAERKVSVMTALAILKEADTASQHRGYGLRDKYAYFLPLVGRVCRATFTACYGVSVPTIARFRTRIKDGWFAPRAHGGCKNKNASKIDDGWLIAWFTELASEIGDVVPIKVRRQATVNGLVTRYYSPMDYTLLPAHMTWDRLYNKMLNYIREKELNVAVPAASTMRQLLSKKCPTIRIRSARSNVCDECSIYHSRVRGVPTTDETEAFGMHTAAARRMRLEYRTDMDNIDDKHAVIVMDFSQNLTLPSLASTPPQWYFMSLWAVNMFGIYYANRSTQYNYLYGERVAGKGSEEVISMLCHFILNIASPQAPARLTIYADNCTGQNKNNYVVKYQLALVHTGMLQRVDLKFFVKGHTKNAVDRGFGHVHKRFAREDVWTMSTLVDLVKEAAVTSETVPIELDNDVFKSFKPLLTEAYRDIPSIRKYQLFTATADQPGVVQCRVGPDDDPVVIDLRETYDGLKVSGERVEMLLDDHLDNLPPPMNNNEKVVQMHDKVRPYVPDEYRSDPLYALPTDEQENEAKAIKQTRAAKRKRQDDNQPVTAAEPGADANDCAQPKSAAVLARKKARKEVQ